MSIAFEAELNFVIPMEYVCTCVYTSTDSFTASSLFGPLHRDESWAIHNQLNQGLIDSNGGL